MGGRRRGDFSLRVAARAGVHCLSFRRTGPRSEVCDVAKRHTNRIGDLDTVFVRLEELVVANSGEDDFDEVFKLVMARLWDERASGPSRFKPGTSPAGTLRTVTALIREADAAWPGVLPRPLRPRLAAEHLEVCVEALARHTLSTQRFEVLDGLFERMVSHAAKGAKGQYFTPRYVTELCVRMLRPGPHETVLDPACGSGGFLVQALAAVRAAAVLDEASVKRYAAEKIHGWDVDPRALQVARALMTLAGGANAQLVQRNSLVSQARERTQVDVILTNPPFAGDVREVSLLAGYELARGRAQVERDVLFLERCVRLLRPGGRMAVVLPHNKLGTDIYGPLRQWLMERCRVLAVVGLGRNTFLPYTHQKAGVLVAQRRVPGDRGSNDESIFFATTERDGKDARGRLVLHLDRDPTLPLWDRVDHDLASVVEAFHLFCTDEGVPFGESRWPS